MQDCNALSWSKSSSVWAGVGAVAAVRRLGGGLLVLSAWRTDLEVVSIITDQRESTWSSRAGQAPGGRRGGDGDISPKFMAQAPHRYNSSWLSPLAQLRTVCGA